MPQEQELAAHGWQQIVEALLTDKWPPGTHSDDDEDDDDEEGSVQSGCSDDDEDQEVPDWHAGFYYALDGSVASYDAECQRDPYKQMALEA